MNRLNTDTPMRQREGSLLSPVAYDDDAASLHSRSDQDSDSDDDQLQQAARNSRELRAHDRIVLVEEEDIDRLVTDSRKKQERERRGSGLAVPNPLNLFRRPSLSSMSMSSAASSTEDLHAEKRRQRRSRRQRKRKVLLERAEHGEDGELMYEMEEGGMKEGSITGDSSDRDDSDEMDRRHLGLMAHENVQRRRSWRRWLLIHVLIAIGFTILVLVAWKLTKAKKHNGAAVKDRFVSNGTALFGPTTLVISLDGFRADFLHRGLTPRLNAFVKEGVSPKWMHPSFPSVTFPNHYTLATGLYPEAHGIVGNTFWDPELKAEFYYTDPERSLDPKWWGGEPFWATAERQGVRSAVHMWPGSEAHILNIEPSVLDKYNGHEKLDSKVKRIMEFLDMPGKEDETLGSEHWRPQLIAAYVPDVDADGHKFGPNSTEIRTTIQAVDTMMDNIFQGLEARNLTHIVNVVVVSDHGMATTDRARLLQLEDLIDTSKIEHTDGWPLMGLRPKNPEDTQSLYDGIKAKANPNIEVYMRDVDMPERYHFSKNERIAPLWIVPKTGWAIVKKDEFDLATVAENEVYHPRGLHGYDHEHPLMRAIFIARGPAFPHPANSKIEPFQNIELYNLLCDSVGITPQPNNGTLRLPLKPVGTHTEEAVEEQDPVQTETVTESSLPSTSAQPTATSSSSITEASPSPTPATESETETTTATSAAPEKTEAPQQPEAGGGSEDEVPGDDQNPDLIGSIVGAVGDAWDWLTGQAGKVWNDITGGPE